MENLERAIALTTLLMRSLHDSDTMAALVCIEILDVLESVKTDINDLQAQIVDSQIHPGRGKSKNGNG